MGAFNQKLVTPCGPFFYFNGYFFVFFLFLLIFLIIMCVPLFFFDSF